MKILEKKDVQEVFERLLNQNGKVTSKEVKDELREMGFWAIQAQVASFIRQNHEDWGTIVNYNGQYNIYVPAYFKDDETEEDALPSMDNITTISVDVEADDEPPYKKKCKVTTTHRISDDEFHINVYSPIEMKNINVVVNKFDFDYAQYTMSYMEDIIGYVGSEDVLLTNKQARYYAWKIFKDTYPGMEYFDVRCSKLY